MDLFYKGILKEVTVFSLYADAQKISESIKIIYNIWRENEEFPAGY